MKTYIGERHGDSALTRVLVDDGTVRAPLGHDVKHSPTGFEWGYAGSGPSELARCILIDYLEGAGQKEEMDWVEANYQAFKFDVVAGLPKEGFELTEQQVSGWAEAKGTAP